MNFRFEATHGRERELTQALVYKPLKAKMVLLCMSGCNKLSTKSACRNLIVRKLLSLKNRQNRSLCVCVRERECMCICIYVCVCSLYESAVCGSSVPSGSYWACSVERESRVDAPVSLHSSERHPEKMLLVSTSTTATAVVRKTTPRNQGNIASVAIFYSQCPFQQQQQQHIFWDDWSFIGRLMLRWACPQLKPKATVIVLEPLKIQDTDHTKPENQSRAAYLTWG